MHPRKYLRKTKIFFILEADKVIIFMIIFTVTALRRSLAQIRLAVFDLLSAHDHM